MVVSMVLTFQYQANHALHKLGFMHPEYLRFELIEADFRRVHLPQIVDAVSIHVLKDSLGQLDEERVVFPSLGKDLNKIDICGPRG